MDEMYVLNFSTTGHVLGAVTRNTQSNDLPTVEEIAPQGIQLHHVHGLEERITVPARELAVTRADYDRDVLFLPHLYVLEQSGGRPRLEQRAYDAGAPPLVALDGANLTITLPAMVTSLTEVVVQISGDNLAEPVVRSESIEENQTSTGAKPLVLQSGVYTVAIFAPGYATVLQSESVP